MSPLIAPLKGSKLALVAYKRFLPRVSFQMSPQIARLDSYIVILVASAPLFATVSFQMSSKWPA